MFYRNILLIDDDIEDQEIFRSALEIVSEKFTFNSFTNAKEALDKLTSNVFKPDVIFLDLNMPVMSGQEFLKEIKKKDETQDIPVIIFSTSTHPSTIKLAKEWGAIDFITKPHRFGELVAILKPLII